MMFWKPKAKIQFACNQCGECCREHIIPVNHFEVSRLIKAGLNPIEFLSLLPTTIEDPDSVLLYEKKQILILKKDKATSDCVFQKDNSCQVYESRPSACHIWPFEKRGEKPLFIAQTHLLLYEMACDKEPFKDHKDIRYKIDQNIEEFRVFRHFCKRWNDEVEKEPQKQNLEGLIVYIKEEFN